MTSVCVYCGARAGRHAEYQDAATAFGTAIADKGWRLVYGAGDIGLMGAVARAAQAAGGETFGVIPQHLVAWEIGKTDLTRYVVTETMHERKKVMLMNADAVALLPGGAGSLDEFFEALTWRQLGLHAKPIILINIEGYWDLLLQMMQSIIQQGFADDTLGEFVQVASTVDEAVDLLSEAFAPA